MFFKTGVCKFQNAERTSTTNNNLFERAFVEIKMLKGLTPLLLYVHKRAFIKFKLLKGPTPHTFKKK